VVTAGSAVTLTPVGFQPQVAALDVAVTKSGSPDPASVGGTLTYTIVVTNSGNLTATGVTLMDTLPSSASFQAVSASQGTCGHSAGTITCTLGSMAPGASITVTIEVRPTAAGTIINSVTVRPNEFEAVVANNAATASGTVVAAPSDIPTLSGSGLLTLGLLLAALGYLLARRRM
jgi:uncharacterized repeat protein (TIGR01451 family)